MTRKAELLSERARLYAVRVNSPENAWPVLDEAIAEIDKAIASPDQVAEAVAIEQRLEEVGLAGKLFMKVKEGVALAYALFNKPQGLWGV